jgi:ATP-binding cassette subfamily F protein uup
LHLLSLLFRNPNFLILDEPTNDLDLPTLGVLEDFLSEFPGCLIIVSHDRYFMDRLVDHLFVFEGDGIIKDFPGNYSQYRMWKKEQEMNLENELISKNKEQSLPNKTTNKKRQPSYKEKKEFEVLEKEIADLTKEKITITEKLNNGNIPFPELQQLSERIVEVTRTLDEKEMRWLQLSEINDD